MTVQREQGHIYVMMMLLGGVLCLFAATAQALDLWTAWRFAQERDPIYATAQASSAADQHLIGQARAQLLPHIHASAGVDHHDRRNAKDFGNAHSSHNNLWAFTLTQPLFDRQNLRLYEHAQYLAAMAVVDEENARAELMLRLSQTYFDTLNAQDTLHSLRAQLKATEKQHQAALRAFELGSATITDAQEAQSRLDLLRAQIVTAEDTLRQQFYALERMIGQPSQDLATLRTDAHLPAPEPDDPNQWQTQAGEHNLAVTRADLALQAQQQYLESSKSRHDPTVQLQARTGSQHRNNAFTERRSPRSMDSSISIELSIPIFTGGEISAKVQEESERLRQRHFERENARRAAVEAAQRYFSGVTSGLLEVRSLEEAKKSSQSALEANQLAYQVGVRTLVDVLNAQQQFYETRRSLFNARYRVLLNSLQLKYAAGTLTDDDLWAINQLLETQPTEQTLEVIPTEQEQSTPTPDDATAPITQPPILQR
ncbi:MAG TPA: TolC family outer membrane protein [Paenalcaligenes sp.]|nr:TolC family outer membrane protein [Paenalcaligenes sp.]